MRQDNVGSRHAVRGHMSLLLLQDTDVFRVCIHVCDTQMSHGKPVSGPHYRDLCGRCILPPKIKSVELSLNFLSCAKIDNYSGS